MGADLCGHIMVGPIKLNRKKLDRLQDDFQRIQAILRPAFSRLEKVGNVTIGKLQKEVGLEGSKELARLVNAPSPTRAYITLWADDNDPLMDWIKRIVELDVSELLSDFVSMWECEGRYRDKMSRYTPDSRQRIVVVGERTWGSGPEKGSAWWLANQMSDFNLLAPLGIR